jgi:hypothetical protein
MAQLVAVKNLMIIEASIFRDLGAEGRAMAIKRKASFNLLVAGFSFSGERKSARGVRVRRNEMLMR